MEDILVQRQTAIHLLRSGLSVKEVAEQLGRSTVWVYKCQHRYEQGQWAGLQERSRAPGHCPRQLPLEIRQAICQARSELEAEGVLVGFPDNRPKTELSFTPCGARRRF